MNKLMPALLTMVLALLLSASVMGAPRLTIPEANFDFGYCPQNSKISHDFWLKSTGDDSLKILKVTPG